MNLKKLVLATDFSEASMIALETALALALESKAKLYLIHAVEYPPMAHSEEGTEELLDMAYHIHEDRLASLVPVNCASFLNVETAVLTGSAAEEIARFASDVGADLIVVGTHGRTGLARVLMGSTAEHLLRHAPCQVLVVKPKAHAAA